MKRPRVIHRASSVVLLAAIGALLLLGESASAAPPPSEAEVAQALTCQCGCGLTVANCNHPTCSFSVPLRGEIDGMIRKGMGRAQIVSFFQVKYGEKILSAPTTRGFNLLAWLMPFVAIVLGGGLVAIASKRWHRVSTDASAQARAAPRDLILARELKRRLEAELKES